MKITSVVLDEHPPAFELDSGIIAGKTDIPIIPERWMCSSPTGALKAEALALMLQMKKNPLKESRRVISEMKQTAHPDKIAVLACALELMFDYEESKNIGLWMKEAHPTHYTVKLKLAEEAATGADWPCVITTLDGITLEGIDDGTARHLCHLLGIAYFVEGDVKTALRTWHKGLEYADGECDLTSYIKFAELTLLSPQQRKEFEAENKLAKKLNLMEEIDRHASNMNWTAVINLFETEYTMENADVQTLSRLVHAYLNMNYEPGDVRWISKLIVMAHYCARFKDSYRAEYLLPPCIEKWSTTRLNDIFINAEQWLETMQSFPLSHPALRGIQREGRPS